MKAMILAAGLGTRLRPLTDKIPKALIPVVNTPVILRTVDYLSRHGIHQIIVNAHHLSRQLIEFLNTNEPADMNIEVRTESRILGTGGGIKNVEDFFDNECFVVINSDIVLDIDLSRALKQHREQRPLATLIVHDREPYNQLWIEKDGTITDIGTVSTPGRKAFTGIHILEPEIFSHIPAGGFFDIIDCYRHLIVSGKVIKAHGSSGHYWRDIGTIRTYMVANREVSEQPFTVGPGCSLDSSATLRDWAVIGPDCILEKDAHVCRAILWSGVHVRAGVRIVDSIATHGKQVTRNLHQEIL
jgi:NDP-sugar pyrophosphorylase family protein